MLQIGNCTINSGLKIALNKVATKLGFSAPVTLIVKTNEGRYRGYIHISKVNSYDHDLPGTTELSYTLAENSAFYHAISFLTRQYNVVVMDPSYFVLSDMRKTKNAIPVEMLILPTVVESISHIGEYVQDEMNKIADAINWSSGNNNEDSEFLSILHRMVIMFEEHVKRVKEIERFL